MVSSGSLRIAHFSDTYLPRRCGIQTSLQVLIAALAEAGHTCLLVVPAHRSLRHQPGLYGLPGVPTGVVGLRLVWPRERYVRKAAAWRPDVIHVHTPGPIGLLGVLTGRRLKVPVVHTYHSDYHAQAAANQVPTFPIRIGASLFARRLGLPCPPHEGLGEAIDANVALLFHDADAVITPTPAILRRVRLPVPQERIFQVPTGLAPVPVSSRAAQDFRARFGIPAQRRIVLFVGRVNPEKNVELLIEAFRLLGTRVPEAHLVLIGAIWRRRWLRRLLTPPIEHLTLTGVQPKDVVAAAYSAATVFAHPSVTDTQALVHQEAALAGVPTVLTDAELHSTGPLHGASVLAEPQPGPYADALDELLGNPEKARELGRAARQAALRHTPQHFAASVTRVYDHARETACS